MQLLSSPCCQRSVHAWAFHSDQKCILRPGAGWSEAEKAMAEGALVVRALLPWCPMAESACSAGDLGLIPGLGSSPGEGNGYPLL